MVNTDDSSCRKDLIMAGLDDLKLHWIFHLKVEAGYIIAGGFFRDNLLGVSPKDIDIYVAEVDFQEFLSSIRSKIAAIEEITVGEVEPILKSVQSTWKKMKKGSYEEVSEAEEKLPIRSIVKITTWMGEKLDVVVLTRFLPLEEILRSFDFTVNQFGWIAGVDGGDFLASAAGLKDLWNRKLTAYKDGRASDERIAYMEAKGFKRS